MNTRIPIIVLLSVLWLAAVHAFGLWQSVKLANSLDVARWMPYSVLVVSYGGLAVLFLMMLRGKRWARTGYTALAVLGAVILVGQAGNITALGWLLAATRGAALVLLYVSVGGRWFDRKAAVSS